MQHVNQVLCLIDHGIYRCHADDLDIPCQCVLVKGPDNPVIQGHGKAYVQLDLITDKDIGGVETCNGRDFLCPEAAAEYGDKG